MIITSEESAEVSYRAIGPALSENGPEIHQCVSRQASTDQLHSRARSALYRIGDRDWVEHHRSATPDKAREATGKVSGGALQGSGVHLCLEEENAHRPPLRRRRINGLAGGGDLG